jgi:hypothetical protein
MRTTRLMTFVVRTAAMARKACGLALVLAAISGVALAKYNKDAAPEIDPGSMAGALTLLGGGLLMLTDRFRR